MLESNSLGQCPKKDVASKIKPCKCASKHISHFRKIHLNEQPYEMIENQECDSVLSMETMRLRRDLISSDPRNDDLEGL